MDTERVFRATTSQFTKEDHLVIHLLHRDIVVLDAREVLLHLVQLMIMCGKKRTGLCLGMLMQVFHNSPGNTDTIVGGSAAPQLIEEHQRLRSNVVQDIRRLSHLHHKRGFTQRNVIRCPYPCENLVHQTDSRALCGHKTTDLGQ